jgi:hypothetical protein
MWIHYGVYLIHFEVSSTLSQSTNFPCAVLVFRYNRTKLGCRQKKKSSKDKSSMAIYWGKVWCDLIVTKHRELISKVTEDDALDMNTGYTMQLWHSHKRLHGNNDATKACFLVVTIMWYHFHLVDLSRLYFIYIQDKLLKLGIGIPTWWLVALSVDRC